MAPPYDPSDPPYNPLDTYGACNSNSCVFTQCIPWPTDLQLQARLQASTSRKRKMNELEDEYPPDFKVTTERERLTRTGMKIVSYWNATRNKLARAVVTTALYDPIVLSEVTGFESKLYTALTNVVWVDKRDRSMCAMSMREASELVAFVSSMIGPTKHKEAYQGPIRRAATGEGILKEDENAMHRFLRTLGYTKLEIPTASAYSKWFWSDLYTSTYGRESMRGGKTPDLRASIDDFWMKAIEAWMGPESESDHTL